MSLISAQNFAQPLWLWALLLIPSGWVWYWLSRKYGRTNFKSLSKFIDPNLMQYVVLNSGGGKRRGYVGLLYSLLVFCMVLALANPRWSYTDIEAFQPTASMVILLDLSSTMNATDVSPSRIIRARQTIEDLLNLSKGIKIGLIGFAGYPHLISPITDDVQTIKTYIPALDTDLTSVQGNSLHSALRMAAELLGNEPGDKKSIVLLSDGNLASDDFSHELNSLDKQNVQVHVVGVGTATGAPYKNKSGSLHKSQGKLVISQLNTALLKNIAQQGHGIYTEAGLTDLGLRAILSKAEAKEQEHILAGKVREWDDRYYLFLVPAAGIMLFLMRQRILYILILGIISSGMFNQEAYALEIKNPFLNSEQKGQRIYQEGKFVEAAQAFNDPYHKGVALYRAGQFAEAEQEFKQVKRENVKIAAMYNAGNSQMQQRKWSAAIKSYEALLSTDPDNFAAQHNLEIARKMLAENNEQDDQSNCECNNKDKQSNTNDKQSQSNNQKSEQSDKANQQQQEQDIEQNIQDNLDQKSYQQDQEDAQHQQQNNQADFMSNNDKNKRNGKEQAMQNLTQLSEDEARVEQWLNRVDSDIKVFLKNKFYVEDVLGAQ